MTAPQETAGKRGKCLTCGTIVVVPRPDASGRREQGATPIHVSATGSSHPIALGTVGSQDEPTVQSGWPSWLLIVLVGVIFVFVLVLLGIVFQSFMVVVWTVLALFLVVILCWLHVFLAKSRAFHKGIEDTPLFGGLVRMILWNPTQGVLLLKNKQVVFVDSNINDGGGVKYIIPALGQEVGLRVPLTVQTTEIVNEKVYTRDSVPLDMKLTVWWKIRDLQQFYLYVGREVHRVNDEGNHIRRGGGPPGFRGEGLTYASREQLLPGAVFI